MRKINQIIIHHSASDYGNAAIIDQWHRKRGWECIGYHFVITNGVTYSDVYNELHDGLIESGRNLEMPGAHCKGQNDDSIGICLINKGNDYSINQYKSLVRLICNISFRYDFPPIYQHSHYNEQKSECAGLKQEFILKWRENYELSRR